MSYSFIKKNKNKKTSVGDIDEEDDDDDEYKPPEVSEDMPSSPTVASSPLRQITQTTAKNSAALSSHLDDMGLFGIGLPPSNPSTIFVPNVVDNVASEVNLLQALSATTERRHLRSKYLFSFKK